MLKSLNTIQGCCAFDCPLKGIISHALKHNFSFAKQILTLIAEGAATNELHAPASLPPDTSSLISAARASILFRRSKRSLAKHSAKAQKSPSYPKEVNLDVFSKFDSRELHNQPLSRTRYSGKPRSRRQKVEAMF